MALSSSTIVLVMTAIHMVVGSISTKNIALCMDLDHSSGTLSWELSSANHNVSPDGESTFGDNSGWTLIRGSNSGESSEASGNQPACQNAGPIEQPAPQHPAFPLLQEQCEREVHSVQWVGGRREWMGPLEGSVPTSKMLMSRCGLVARRISYWNENLKWHI